MDQFALSTVSRIVQCATKNTRDIEHDRIHSYICIEPSTIYIDFVSKYKRNIRKYRFVITFICEISFSSFPKINKKNESISSVCLCVFTNVYWRISISISISITISRGISLTISRAVSLGGAYPARSSPIISRFEIKIHERYSRYHSLVF